MARFHSLARQSHIIKTPSIIHKCVLAIALWFMIKVVATGD